MPSARLWPAHAVVLLRPSGGTGPWVLTSNRQRPARTVGPAATPLRRMEATQGGLLLVTHCAFFAFGWVFFYRKLFKNFEVRQHPARGLTTASAPTQVVPGAAAAAVATAAAAAAAAIAAATVAIAAAAVLLHRRACQLGVFVFPACLPACLPVMLRRRRSDTCWCSCCSLLPSQVH
eukprot:COSAG01_NODE_2329_length_7892_cov_2.592711_6_plen_177_part_00